jgi:PAS domain S-box-containing protein
MSSKLSPIAFRTTLLYASIGILWITLSDLILDSMFPSSGTLNRLQTYKGWGFVLFTAIGLYLLLRAQLQRWEREATNRRKIEQALGESELRLSAILDSVTDAVITVDQEQRIQFFNPAAEKLFRCNAAEALGSSINNFIPMRFRTAHSHHMHNFVATDENLHKMRQNRNICGLRADGEEFPIEASISQIKLEDKNLYTITLRDITQRLEAESAVQERLKLQERLEKIAATAPGALISYRQRADESKALVYASPLIEDIYGLRPEEVQEDATLAFERMHPDDLQQVREKIAESARNLSMWQAEFRVFHPQKGEIWVEGRTMPEPEADGSMIWHGFIHEITERKRAEAALREKEERLRLALAGGHMGTWEWNFKTNRGNADALDAQLLGWGESSKEYTHEDLMAVVHPDDRAELLNFIENAPGKVEEGRHEFRIVWPDGSVHWLVSCGQTIFDSDHRPIKTIGINYDISEHRQAQETIQRFVACNPSVIYALKIKDGRFQKIWVSKNIFELTGYAADETQDPDWWENNIHPEDRQRVLATHPVPYEVEHQVLEFRFRRKDGSYFWARDDKRLIRDAQGNPTEVIGSWSDISERIQLEEQLRQSQKLEAIGQLAGGVAHDFNNLLTVIMGYSEMILRKLMPEDTMRNQIATIRQAGERASSLTRQLLAFSRKQVLAPKVLDLNEVVANIEKMLRRLIGEDIILKTAFAPTASPIKVDPGQIEQVIINLAVNARDAMPQGGELKIETCDLELDEEFCRLHPAAVPGRYTQLVITDSGCGMPPEVKARIFEPFFTTKGVGKGTGLGLATVFGIIKQSEGYIEVDSTIGKGTTFKIYLPAIEMKERHPVAVVSPESIQRGDETILLVEDEDGVRQIAKLTLEMNGYKVIEANSGREAIRQAQNFAAPIHVLITDIVMPEIGGRQVAEQVQTLHPKLKVLYMSGYIDDALVRHGITVANEAFLQKPFLPLTLAQKVREVITSKNGANGKWGEGEKGRKGERVMG